MPWGQTWQRCMGDRGRYPSRVVNPDELIDTWFEITSELLAVQRECTKALLALSQPGLAAVTFAARQALRPTTSHRADRSGGGADQRRFHRPPGPGRGAPAEMTGRKNHVRLGKRVGRL